MSLYNVQSILTAILVKTSYVKTHTVCQIQHKLYNINCTENYFLPGLELPREA